MAPIIVEPEALAGAGVSVSGVADELAGALRALAAGLPSGAMAGHDRAGLAFGQAYQQAAQALLNAGGAAVDGGRKVGFGVQMSATNYSHADASSTIGGGATALAPPAPPGAFDAPSVPSPFGDGVAEPFLWSMVQMLVGDAWPDGDPAQLRAAAGAWQSFATTLTGIAGQLEAPSATVAGQQVPEGGAMGAALSDLSRGLSDIASESGKLATPSSSRPTWRQPRTPSATCWAGCRRPDSSTELVPCSPAMHSTNSKRSPRTSGPSSTT